MAKARERLQWLIEREDGRPNRYCERWQQLLDEGPEAVMRVLCDVGEEDQVLRTASPWVGIISAEERDQIVAEFQAWWRQRESAR